MKQITIFILISTISLSCSKDNPKEFNSINPFLGKWTLNLVTGGFFMPEIYDEGQIIFDFKDDNTVHIDFNTSILSSSKLPIKNDTVITYQFDSLVINLDGTTYNYVINDNKLTIGNNSSSDGISFQFGKCDIDNPCTVNDPPIIQNPFLGEWTLNLVTGGFFMPEMYDECDIIFDFMENNTVQIDFKTSILNSSKLPIKNDTIITYQFDSLILNLGGMEYNYAISENKLTIGDNSAADGISLQFGKCNPCNINIPPNVDNPFLGEWNLNLLSGGFSMPEMYENGDIIFDFRDDNNVDVKFKISIPESSKLPIQNDTILVYRYDSLSLQLGDVNYDYLIEDSKLTIGQDVAADGIILEFNK